MNDNIISAIREYISKAPALQSFSLKHRHIDFTDDSNDNYGIIPDGETTLKSFITGGGKMQYPFTLYISKLSNDDVVRINNAALLENLRTWCNQQTLLKSFPALPDGCTPVRITAENGMLLNSGVGNKRATYQIQFKLIYLKS